jgi:hypothetical protein
VPDPAFYAYSYPEPAGFSERREIPDSAYYSSELKEFIFPYEAVRASSRPDQLLLDFLQATYDIGAELGDWDRLSLERVHQEQR